MITGSAMRKPRIHPGRGSWQRRLDDRRPHDRDRHRAAVLQEGPLAEGLGVGVGVGPAEGRGAGAAGLDHLLLHPRGAALLGLGRQRRDAGGAQLGAGLLAEPLERIGAAALRVGVGAGPAGAVDLAPPVDVDEERALVHRLLGGGAASVAGHVAGGHGDEVGRDAEVGQRGDDPARPEQVDLDGGVERASRTTPWRPSGSRRRRTPARRGRRRRGPARRCRRHRRSA